MHRFAAGMIALSALCANTAPRAETGGGAACSGWLLSYRPATPALYDFATWTPEQQRTAAAHGAYLESLDKQGRIAFAGRAFEFEGGGRLAPRSFALVIVRAADRNAAAALAEADPAVTGRLFAAEIGCFEQVYPQGPGR